MNPAQIFSQTLNFNLGKYYISTSWVQAALIVILLFLLVLTMAKFRRHMFSWSMKGALFGIFIGFFLALILEGFLIIGGKTAFTEVMGWENAPKPIKIALEAGRAKLVAVLGATEEIPTSVAKEVSLPDDVIGQFQSLNPQDAAKVRRLICEP